MFQLYQNVLNCLNKDKKQQKAETPVTTTTKTQIVYARQRIFEFGLQIYYTAFAINHLPFEVDMSGTSKYYTFIKTKKKCSKTVIVYTFQSAPIRVRSQQMSGAESLK